MNLFYAPGACSLAPHILLLETGLPFTLDRVDGRTKITAAGRNYLDINPHGYVPTLELADGTLITEGPVIMQYIGDQVPDSGLVPAHGSMQRYQLQSWLNFITSEIHKGFGPLFADDTPIHYKPALKDRLRKRFGEVNKTLAEQPYLMGEHFTVADAHLWVMVHWCRDVGIDPDIWPSVVAFEKRVRARPSVVAALREEGLAW